MCGHRQIAEFEVLDGFVRHLAETSTRLPSWGAPESLPRQLIPSDLPRPRRISASTAKTIVA